MNLPLFEILSPDDHIIMEHLKYSEKNSESLPITTPIKLPELLHSRLQITNLIQTNTGVVNITSTYLFTKI